MSVPSISLNFSPSTPTYQDALENISNGHSYTEQELQDILVENRDHEFTSNGEIYTNEFIDDMLPTDEGALIQLIFINHSQQAWAEHFGGIFEITNPSNVHQSLMHQMSNTLSRLDVIEDIVLETGEVYGAPQEE